MPKLARLMRTMVQTVHIQYRMEFRIPDSARVRVQRMEKERGDDANPKNAGASTPVLWNFPDFSVLPLISSLLMVVLLAMATSSVRGSMLAFVVVRTRLQARHSPSSIRFRCRRGPSDRQLPSVPICWLRRVYGSIDRILPPSSSVPSLHRLLVSFLPSCKYERGNGSSSVLERPRLLI